MDGYQKAIAALTIGNTIALVGTIIYFHKTITSIKAEQSKISDALGSTIKTLGDTRALVSKQEQIIIAIRKMDAEIIELQKLLDQSVNIDELQPIMAQLNTIMQSVRESGIDVTQIVEAPVVHQQYYPPPTARSNTVARPRNNIRKQEEPLDSELSRQDISDSVASVRRNRGIRNR